MKMLFRRIYMYINVVRGCFKFQSQVVFNGIRVKST